MHVGSVLVFEGDRRRTTTSSSRRSSAGCTSSPATASGWRSRRSARRGPCGSTTRTSTPATTCATPRCPRPRARTSCGGSPGACSRSSSTARSRCGRSGSSTSVDGDRFALICKTHHALVDGISGVDIMTVLFDLDAGPARAPSPAPAWAARPLPGRAELLADALAERVTAPCRARARGALGARTARVPAAGRTVAGLAAMAAAGVAGAPPSPLNVRIGPHRRFAWASRPTWRRSRRSRTRWAARSTTSC